MARKQTRPLYLIPILSKGLNVLELLQAESGSLTLEAIYKRTRFSKTTIYRVPPRRSHPRIAGRPGRCPIIADRIAAGGIPLIAIDIPHPHATFFGIARPWKRSHQ